MQVINRKLPKFPIEKIQLHYSLRAYIIDFLAFLKYLKIIEGYLSAEYLVSVIGGKFYRTLLMTGHTNRGTEFL